MPRRTRPVMAFNCPNCETSRVVQREEGPTQLLDWEDTLFTELVFECRNCEWSQLVGRNPVAKGRGIGL